MLSKRHRILVVDDNAHVCAALERLFTRDGHRVVVAKDADEALALLQREPIDLAIIDYDMPGVTGLELAARLKVLYPLMVRMLLTSETDFLVAVEAINRAGVYRYMVKPWDNTKLRITVALALDEAERLRQTGPRSSTLHR